MARVTFKHVSCSRLIMYRSGSGRDAKAAVRTCGCVRMHYICVFRARGMLEKPSVVCGCKSNATFNIQILIATLTLTLTLTLTPLTLTSQVMHKTSRRTRGSSTHARTFRCDISCIVTGILEIIAVSCACLYLCLYLCLRMCNVLAHIPQFIHKISATF